MLLSTVVGDTRSLRIDVAQADQLVGSAQNIARVNTNAVSAFNSAKFAEIDVEIAENGDRKHIFVTQAYQNVPERAYFLTVTEVTYRAADGTWTEDKSQEFKVLRENLRDDGYLKALGIRSSKTQPEPGQLTFTIFFADP